MSFQATAARSSRITKPRKQSAASALGLRRTTSSPSTTSTRRKTSQPTRSTSFAGEDEKLDDTGEIASLAADLNFRDVPQYMEYIRNRMFQDIPQTGAGMNSTRIAEVLNYRKALPPIVTIAHIDALSSSSTTTEREIVELAQAGVLRRVIIPNRGVGAAAVGDGIASVIEWQRLIRSHPDLDADLKEKYIAVMNSNPTTTAIPSTAFTPAELSALTASGFLTSCASPDNRSSLFASPGAGSLGTLASLSSAGSRHAAGSLAAVGGAEATKHMAGGGIGHRKMPISYYNFSLPHTGSHMKLLVEARTHFLSLLNKSKHKEAPFDIMRERWDGGIPAQDQQARAKRARGEFTGVLPRRTKKWKHFYGMRFEWILEECVGAGLVECFQTGSVGLAVRTIT
ncbi:hypothetical protein BU24DRAFT_184871 [Aaosphaeria arxii CBS 175.79]|uniref:Serine-threonine protein kinase 19 n=1 Tax=Aaosphaeria arxii CBS 175.79 TaxID=1450172 RepID=A0A6A5XSH5_9PLEO|nr:uncharacterized protein BU24DRAFT_184871 [Aaosphaeria arxii CBS 175.79]KAF2015757.1 hypothetical protein BU24DRAFT_184871 [Aaosphaeria arxii CBS 175.79]